MSPSWTGWIFLHGMLLAGFLFVTVLVAGLGVRAAARWLLRRWWSRM